MSYLKSSCTVQENGAIHNACQRPNVLIVPPGNNAFGILSGARLVLAFKLTFILALKIELWINEVVGSFLSIKLKGSLSLNELDSVTDRFQTCRNHPKKLT